MEGIVIFILIFVVFLLWEASRDKPKETPQALFLDDEREPPYKDGPWDVVRTAPDAIRALMHHNYRIVSLDHDLGPADAGTGYDVIQWLEAQAAAGKHVPEDIRIHTMNPVAARRMEAARASIWRLKSLRATEFFVDRHGHGG